VDLVPAFSLYVDRDLFGVINRLKRINEIDLQNIILGRAHFVSRLGFGSGWFI